MPHRMLRVRANFVIVRYCTRINDERNRLSGHGPNISFANVPPESLESYQFKNGSALTAARFNVLPAADKYHLLPSGYAQGWVDAFNALGITADEWAAQGFGVPIVSGFMTADDIVS